MSSHLQHANHHSILQITRKENKEAMGDQMSAENPKPEDEQLLQLHISKKIQHKLDGKVQNKKANNTMRRGDAKTVAHVAFKYSLKSPENTSILTELQNQKLLSPLTGKMPERLQLKKQPPMHHSTIQTSTVEEQQEFQNLILSSSELIQKSKKFLGPLGKKQEEMDGSINIMI